MCGVLSGLMRAGRLPATHAAIRRHRLWLVDAGAAFGGETVVGHAMGFRVMAVEGRPPEAAKLEIECGRLRGVTVVNAILSNTTVPTQTRLLNADDSSSVIPRAVATGAEQ
jgi:hypothetical protein